MEQSRRQNSDTANRPYGFCAEEIEPIARESEDEHRLPEDVSAELAMYDTGGDVTRLSSLAKLDVSEVSREVAEDAVQVLGGDGYTEDFGPQRFYRDAKLMENGEGTARFNTRGWIANSGCRTGDRRDGSQPSNSSASSP